MKNSSKTRFSLLVMAFAFLWLGAHNSSLAQGQCQPGMQKKTCKKIKRCKRQR